MILFKGAATALITPFTAGGESIDYDALALQINWQINQGIDALVIAGTTGETSALSDAEHKSLIEFAVKTVNKRVPLIAGTGSNNTKHTIELSQFAKSCGADGVLIVNPYYNKSTQKGLIAHYTALHDATDIPIILYNVPSRTGMNIAPETVHALSALPRIVGIKEASNQFSQITEIARLLPPDFSLYSGNDDTVIPVLALGGHGVISVASNVLPKEIHNMVKSFLNGDLPAARRMQFELKPFIDALFLETNPAPVKMAMALLDRSPGQLRLPMIEVEEKTTQAILREIHRLNIQKGWDIL